MYRITSSSANIAYRSIYSINSIKYSKDTSPLSFSPPTSQSSPPRYYTTTVSSTTGKQHILQSTSAVIDQQTSIQNPKPSTPPSPASSPEQQKQNQEFEFVQRIYSTKTTSELLFNYSILKLCSFPLISDNCDKFIKLGEKLGVSGMMFWFIKRSFFKQFCAGETIEETTKSTKILNNRGIGAILDYSVEDLSGSPEGFDQVADQVIQTIKISAENPNLSFSCIKITGLSNPTLLEKMNKIVSSLSPNQFKESLADPLSLYLNHNNNIFDSQEKKDLESFFKRVERIFDECLKTRVPILLDAEQTWYQEAIHHLSLAYSMRYNKEKPLLYNTFQMYLQDSMETLNQHLEFSKQLGFKLGAKIVRGAYMVSERERAQEIHYPDPIQPDIQHTHNNYNNAIHLLLNTIKEQGKDSLGVMIASHNVESALIGVKLIQELGIDSTSTSIQFGQLFGMADYLTYDLVSQNQRVFKYVPYGPVKEVIPYLVRRMHENKGFIGSGSEKELRFLKKEIKRRLF
ncbi:hypothetical protein CYY_002020 [Polysphondylium violaceum]|uniref:Proline dehydrogenase n=1 Tax=Polysphondylium violaceum TaxID=133409 RepID=A0A8J4V138_9MYCE|nr:hypothetical protein CYY_002020 [Polysphondylium violaceum]